MDRQRIDRDRPLIKIYKDLMVTKRDLIDLRESITHTIHSIRHSDDAIRQLRVKRCQQCGDLLQQAQPHQCQELPCGLCNKKFLGILALNQHRRVGHHICQNCLTTYSEPQQEHEEHNCPETLTQCQCCLAKVTKRELNKHFRVCGFRQCLKCKQDIYVKAYAYHLLECGKASSKHLISPCKKLPREKRPFILPCCLVVEGFAQQA